MARLMFGTVGIPCLIIHGYAGGISTPDEPNTEYTSVNHAWNAVYVDNRWHLLDITWDSRNKYYGKSSEKNINLMLVKLMEKLLIL